MQNRVFVLDTNQAPQAPIRPAEARLLLSQGKAAVYQRFPFTIILKEAKSASTAAEIEVKIDPGSKTTGIALVQDGQVIFAAELEHRGQTIKKALQDRRALRRGRRNRKTRYRQPRFQNRTRPKGWLPPSIKSRIDNILTWVARFCRYAPIAKIVMELVRFDMQKMQDAEISGVEYQQGELQGYEVREYLLEKWGRKCAYCGAKDVPLQVEHITARVRGGSNRVSNLTTACEPCNLKKGIRSAAEFGHPAVQAQAKAPLKDAAAVNAARWSLFNQLKASGLPVFTGSGGRTKFNRLSQGYLKEHWIDAACVGESGANIVLCPATKPLLIKAIGRQCRQMCRPDKYGFPRTGAKENRVVKGFQTGDIVRAIVPSGKQKGVHIGRVAVRAKGSFNISSVRRPGSDGIGWKYCKVLQRADGYSYSM